MPCSLLSEKCNRMREIKAFHEHNTYRYFYSESTVLFSWSFPSHSWRSFTPLLASQNWPDFLSLYHYPIAIFTTQAWESIFVSQEFTGITLKTILFPYHIRTVQEAFGSLGSKAGNWGLLFLTKVLKYVCLVFWVKLMVNRSRSVSVLYSDVPRLEAKFLCEGANNTAGGHLASLNWNIQAFESTHTLGHKITLTIATPATTILFFSFWFLFLFVLFCFFVL